MSNISSIVFVPSSGLAPKDQSTLPQAHSDQQPIHSQTCPSFSPTYQDQASLSPAYHDQANLSPTYQHQSNLTSTYQDPSNFLQTQTCQAQSNFPQTYHSQPTRSHTYQGCPDHARSHSTRVNHEGRSTVVVQQGSHARSTCGAHPNDHESPPPPVKAARRKSLRNAMRRIFGRKLAAQGSSESSSVRDTPQDSPITTSVRHSFVASDSNALHDIPEQSIDATSPPLAPPPDPEQHEDSLRFASVDFPTKHSGRNTRSPFAVEFPHSARLKPLDLGNPFHKDPVPLRRRATEPSVVVDKEEAIALLNMARDDNEERIPTEEEMKRPMTALADEQIGLAVTTSPVRTQNRRSRSVDDLQSMTSSLRTCRPTRRHEAQFWGQEVAATTPPRLMGEAMDNDANFRCSNLVSPISSVAEEGYSNPAVEVGTSPTASQNHDASLTARAAAAKTATPAAPAAPAAPAETPAGSVTADLESRVLKLETDLASFQGALDRMALQRNRRTIIVDGRTPSRSRQNTPSVLVNSLLDADRRLSTESTSEEEAYTIDAPPESGAGITPGVATTRQAYPAPSLGHRRSFSRLHTILEQERHARLTLERQVNELQQTMQDMQDQLSRPIMSLPSNRRSQAVSSQYSRPSDQLQPQTQSTTATSTEYNDGDHPEMPDNRLASRFSTSESLTDSEAARLRSARTSASDALRSPEEVPVRLEEKYRCSLSGPMIEGDWERPCNGADEKELERSV